MSSDFYHHKYSTPNINKVTKDINLLSKEKPINTINSIYNMNNNKNIKLNNLPHSLSLNQNVQYQLIIIFQN